MAHILLNEDKRCNEEGDQPLMVGKRKESFHESNQCPPKRLLSYITDPVKGNVDCEQQNVLYEDFHKRANEVNLLITNNNETIKSKTTLLQHFEAKLQNAKCFEKLFEQLLKFAGGDSIKTVKATAEIVEACADFVATEDSELEYLRQLERIRAKYGTHFSNEIHAVEDQL